VDERLRHPAGQPEVFPRLLVAGGMLIFMLGHGCFQSLVS
jgi:hypothetical protein